MQVYFSFVRQIDALLHFLKLITTTYSVDGSHDATHRMCCLDGFVVPVWRERFFSFNGLDTNHEKKILTQPPKDKVEKNLNTCPPEFFSVFSSQSHYGDNTRPRWGMKFFYQVGYGYAFGYLIVDAEEVSSVPTPPKKAEDFSLQWLFAHSAKRINVLPFNLLGPNVPAPVRELGEKISEAIEIYKSGTGELGALARKARMVRATGPFSDGCPGIDDHLWKVWGDHIFESFRGRGKTWRIKELEELIQPTQAFAAAK